jgi:hypothetical protein
MEMNADMRRRFVLACLAVVLIAGLCGWLMLRPDPVSWALSQQMRRGPGGTVDFAEIAPFPWDRVYFFGPYTSPDRIQRSLGFAWGNVGKTTSGSNEGVNLVVFVRDAEVVYWFELARHEELETWRSQPGMQGSRPCSRSLFPGRSVAWHSYRKRDELPVR